MRPGFEFQLHYFQPGGLGKSLHSLGLKVPQASRQTDLEVPRSPGEGRGDGGPRAGEGQRRLQGVVPRTGHWSHCSRVRWTGVAVLTIALKSPCPPLEAFP